MPISSLITINFQHDLFRAANIPNKRKNIPIKSLKFGIILSNKF